jgi:hypothetical protein
MMSKNKVVSYAPNDPPSAPISAARSIRLKLNRWLIRQTKKMRQGFADPYALRPQTASESLAMISLLGIEKDRAARMVETAQTKLPQFDRLVFVITADALVDATRGGALVETLPGPREVANKPAEAITRYVAGRFEQIQRKWQPDYLLQYGVGIDDYIRELAVSAQGPGDQSF